VRSDTPFLCVSGLQEVAPITTSSAGRDHRAERSALALGIRFDAEWMLNHFMIAQAINCPRKRGNSTPGLILSAGVSIPPCGVNW